MRRNKCVRDVLTKRLEDIASDDGNVERKLELDYLISSKRLAH